MVSERVERERIEIVRQREIILGLEARLKAMIRLRGAVARAQRLLAEGDSVGARRVLAEVVGSWPLM